MKHIQKLRKLILTLGILAGMSLTTYAEANLPTVTISPEGAGTVTTGTTGSGSYVMYTFSATPADGYRFVKWTGNKSNGSQSTYTNNPWKSLIDNFDNTSSSYFTNVTAVFEAIISVSSISLDQSAVSLSVGATQALTPTISPDNATYKTVTWTSDNESVATVSDGVVTAVSEGTANITVTATNGTDDTSDDKTATCAVTIESSVDVTGVSLNKETSTLTVGDTETLTATVSPNDASDKSVTWSSDNTSVATVSNGVITAVAEGTANITVTATNGTEDTSDDKTATCAVTVASAATPISYITTSADPFTTGTYYATFYDRTTSYVADCEVYYATENADGRLTLEKAEGNVIKAGEGVILKATSETVTLTQTDAAASYDSLLTGSDRETTVENALVLSLGKNGVWFYKYSGTLGANKAYLAQ